MRFLYRSIQNDSTEGWALAVSIPNYIFYLSRYYDSEGRMISDDSGADPHPKRGSNPDIRQNGEPQEPQRWRCGCATVPDLPHSKEFNFVKLPLLKKMVIKKFLIQKN